MLQNNLILRWVNNIAISNLLAALGLVERALEELCAPLTHEGRACVVFLSYLPTLEKLLWSPQKSPIPSLQHLCHIIMPSVAGTLALNLYHADTPYSIFAFDDFVIGFIVTAIVLNNPWRGVTSVEDVKSRNVVNACGEPTHHKEVLSPPIIKRSCPHLS